MIKIISRYNECELHINDYALVSDLIKDGAFSMPCGGKGTCLKCKVRIKGDTLPLTAVEEKALSDKEKKEGIRLACQAEIKSGEIILTDNFVSSGITKGSFDIKGGKKGLAVDIGTTTIAAYYYDGEEIKSLSEGNILASYGADVMSRIEYFISNPDNEMHNALVNQVDRIIEALCKENTDITVTGNTVMLHIYVGYPISSMGSYPYTPKSLFGKEVIIKGKKIYIPQCISAFAGADLSCAILASSIYNKERAILIDLGTNGEIALKSKDKIICTAVAAGPAFEGAGITNGIGAVKGAVSKVFAQGTNLKFRTIDNSEPVGICGSGIVDFLAELKRYNAVDENGIIKEEGHPFVHLITEEKGERRIYLSGSDIFITQEDIRKFQLAKSAVVSGINTLMKNEELSYSEIECFYIAGGFGSFINIKNACFVGLIPNELSGRALSIGNAAGMGALMISCGAEVKNEVGEYTFTDLANDSCFQEEFIKNINL